MIPAFSPNPMMPVMKIAVANPFDTLDVLPHRSNDPFATRSSAKVANNIRTPMWAAIR
jgi:hypothetical protein